MTSVTLEQFCNESVFLPIGETDFLPIKALPFATLSVLGLHLGKAKNKTLLQLLKKPNFEAWIQLYREVDWGGQWTKAALKAQIRDSLSSEKDVNLIAESLVDKLSLEALFIKLAEQNRLDLYFDSTLIVQKKDESQATDKVFGTLYISMICSKLGISEINGQKISVNNYLNVLTWPQYYYLLNSGSVMDLIMLSNANALSNDASQKGSKKSRIETEFEAFEKMMKAAIKSNGEQYSESEWFTPEAERAIKGRYNDSYNALYDFFAKEPK
jgi:hypothetical protein